MYLLILQPDNLSMMALFLSIGFVVDDCQLHAGDIVRHIEHGETRLAASLRVRARYRFHHLYP